MSSLKGKDLALGADMSNVINCIPPQKEPEPGPRTMVGKHTVTVSIVLLSQNISR